MARVDGLIEVECQAYTQNHYLFDIIQKERFKKIKNKILKLADVGGITKDAVSAIMSQSENLSMEEHAAEEMTIALDAYGKVACKRIIDNVPMIAQDMFKKLVPALQTALFFTDVELKKLMTENSEVRATRKRAKDTVKAMEKAERMFYDLKSGNLE